MAQPCYATVKSSPLSGKGLFATKDIPPGDLVLGIARPLIAALDIPRLVDTCANCFYWTATSRVGSRGDEVREVKACTRCWAVRYCSKQCQTESWQRIHKHECKVLSKIQRHRELPNGVRATMQILILRFLGGLSELSDFFQLEAHLDDFKAGGTQWKDIEIMAMGALAMSKTPQDPYSVSLAQKMFALVLTNSLTLVTPTFDPLGLVLDPLAARANHSCDPNAVVLMDGPKLSFRSLKPIKADEEIFISYIDTTDPFPRRQAELRSKWYFTCACPKCAKRTRSDTDTFLIPPSRLAPMWVEAADQIVDNDPGFGSDPANFVGDDTASKRVAVHQASAFECLDSARSDSDLGKAIESCEDGLRLCAATGLWPLHRQPYPALRHELFVNLLSMGRTQDLVEALRHAARTYFDVDPVLFGVPWHPVRVVHVWTFAVLALYVSGMAEEREVGMLVEKGLDLGVLVWGLLVEVRGNVEKSHGKESSFAGMVRAKVEEVRVDVSRAGAGKLREAEERREEVWKVWRWCGESLEY